MNQVCNGSTNMLTGGAVTMAAVSLLLLAGASCGRTPDYGQIRRELAERPTTPVVIRHVRLFDSVHAASRPGQTIVIRGERIETVGDDANIQSHTGSMEIDGTGMTMLPGLIDIHAHLRASGGIPYIASGVTTVRDMGNRMDRLLALKKSWDSGAEIGPWVFMAGPLGTQRYPRGVPVENEAQAREAIEKYRQNGYLQIKILDAHTQLVPFIVAESHALGMRVGGHVPMDMRAAAFIDEGIDELQHVHYLLENFASDGLTGKAAAASGARLALDSAPVTGLIDKLKQHNVVVDPTISVYERTYGNTAPAYYRALKAMLRELYTNGVALELGSDGANNPGLSLLREMEIWVEAGIPTSEVLRYATLGNARILKVDADRGTIAAGKRADFVLISGDPSRAISDIRRVEIVSKSGVLFRSENLYQAIGIQPQS